MEKGQPKEYRIIDTQKTKITRQLKKAPNQVTQGAE